MENITIRAFRAVDDHVGCARFVREHIKVLEQVGVIGVVRPDISWCTDPNVYVVVAEHQQLGMVAGIRLHRASADGVLPMQRCMSSLDPDISSALAELLPQGNAEVAGLWNSHRFAGRGVPSLLMEAVVSLASQIGVRALVTFIAEYVAPYAKRVGFVLMDQLINSGRYSFPIPGIMTHAMILPDALALDMGDPLARKRILSLRMRPIQPRKECPKKHELMVNYDLLMDQEEMTRYAGVYRWRAALAA